MILTLATVEDVAAHTRTFWFDAEGPIPYTAGQFIELYLPHEPHDNRGIKRWFTLSSSPTEKRLAITTKYAGEKSSSFKHILWELAPGTRLHALDPMGDFVLPKDHSIPLVFVAGGIGATPMRSMVKYISDTAEQRSITLLYAVNHQEDMAFVPLFSDCPGLSFIPIIAEPPKGYKGETGHVTAERILQALNGNPEAMTYIAGPEPMVEALNNELKAKGIQSRTIVTDFFPGYPAP